MRGERITHRIKENFEPRFQSVSSSLRFQKSPESSSILVKVVSLKRQEWQVEQIEIFIIHHLHDLTFEYMLIFADHIVTKLIRRDIFSYV
jgi:hypothetical protein